MAIILKEPPPLNNNAKADYAKAARVAMENPGKSVSITTHGSSGTATSINLGDIVAFRPRGSFRATHRALGNGEYEVFVRFVGDDNE